MAPKTRLLALTLGLLCTLLCTRACTTIHTSVNSSNSSPDAGNTVIARSMELGRRILLHKWEVVVVPRRSKAFCRFFTLLANSADPSSLQPFNPNTTSNAAGFVAVNVPLYIRGGAVSRYANVVSEGQNEHGLSISAQSLLMSRYEIWGNIDSVRKEKADGGSGVYELAWVDLIPYLLGTFTNAEDAIDALRTQIVVTRSGIFNNRPATGLHWTIDDAHGAHYVIEYIDHKLVVHKSSIGVLTNDPGFSWHVQNLENYANVQAAKPTVPKKMQFAQPTNLYPRPVESCVPSHIPTSHGGGLLGLPGDLSPPARFVRMFYLRSLARFHESPFSITEALALATNLIDSVAIPYGTVLGDDSLPSETRSSESDGTCVEGESPAGPGLEDLLTGNEMQQWAVLKVPAKGLLFYRDYVHSSWKKIDFSELDFSEGAPIKSALVSNPSEQFAEKAPLQEQTSTVPPCTAA